MKLSEYKEIIRPRLSDYRYLHSVNVAKEAARLAEKYGADPEKARLAGILHDITKETPADQQLKIMEKFDVQLTDIERSAPKLWHAISGAVYIEHELGIKDKDILDAVRYHTTGRAGMSLFEKVLFIADFTSEERDYNGVDKMRRAADISLEKAMLEGVTFTITDLASRHKSIHPDTVSTYNWVILNYGDL